MTRLSLVFAVLFGLAACGGSSSATTDGTSCVSTHECVNGVCECTTSGLDGTSCNEDSCEDTCEVCES